MGRKGAQGVMMVGTVNIMHWLILYSAGTERALTQKPTSAMHTVADDLQCSAGL
jgi:hypothetical protein